MTYLDERMPGHLWLAVKFILALIILRGAIHLLGYDLSIPVLDDILNYFIEFSIWLYNHIQGIFKTYFKT